MLFYSRLNLVAVLLCLLLGHTQLGSAQSQVSLSTTSLQFGPTLETQADSLPIILTNTSNRNVQIVGFSFYNTYGQPAFSVLRQPFSIAPAASETIFVRFLPRHNIFHNSEMLIFTDEKRGAIRVDLNGQGRYSINYYDTTQNLEAEALKSALRWRLSLGQITRTYNEARDFMFEEIDNKRLNGQGATTNTIECVYTGRQAVGFTNRSNAQSSFNFNTEHTYPQSLFSSNLPMQSDLHHLFPTDETANSIRSNNPFNVVNSFTWTSGGSKGNATTFEPRDAHKGAASRALLYFGLRYRATAGVNFSWLTPQEAILRLWHQTFLPDVIARRRNIAVQARQGNRNPLVDYPQFLERINNIVNTATIPIERSFAISDTLIDFGFVPNGFTELYRVWMVNTGNFPLIVSNIANTGSGDFSIVSSSSLSIPAGEAGVIEIEYQSNGNAAFGNLTFTTNVPGTGLFSYPLEANGSTGGVSTQTLFGNLQVYPNPVSNGFFWINSPMPLNENQDFQLQIFDVTGKIQPINQLYWSTQQIGVSVDHLSAGVYQILLRSKDGQKSYTAKFIVQP